MQREKYVYTEHILYVCFGFPKKTQFVPYEQTQLFEIK